MQRCSLRQRIRFYELVLVQQRFASAPLAVRLRKLLHSLIQGLERIDIGNEPAVQKGSCEKVIFLVIRRALIHILHSVCEQGNTFGFLRLHVIDCQALVCAAIVVWVDQSLQLLLYKLFHREIPLFMFCEMAKDASHLPFCVFSCFDTV